MIGPALLWISSGLARVFYGGREPPFYWSNGFFWIKMTLLTYQRINHIELVLVVAIVFVAAFMARGAWLL